MAETLTGICREVAIGYGFDRVGISRLEPDTQVVVPVAVHGLGEDALDVRLPLSESPVLEEAYRSQKLSFVDDAQSSGALPAELAQRFGVRSMFVLPLVSGGRCIGFLSGDGAGAAFALDAVEVEVLETAAAFAATLLEKSLVHDELRRLDDARARSPSPRTSCGRPSCPFTGWSARSTTAPTSFRATSWRS